MSTATTATTPEDLPTTTPGTTPRITWRTTAILGAIAVLALAVLGLFAAGGRETTYRISTSNDFFQIPAMTVPSKPTAIVLGLVLVGLAALAGWYTRRQIPTPFWVPISFTVVFLLALITWAAAGRPSSVNLTGLLQGALFLSIPLVFGALAGLLCERSGIINIAIEGQLLGGAFLGAAVAAVSGSAFLGLLFAPLAGALVGVLLAFFSIRYHVDQIVVGVVPNVLVIGLTSFLYSTVLQANSGTFGSVPRLPTLPIPLLSQIPIIGPVLFRQNVLVYIMFIIVVVLQVMVFRSRWGLRVRAVGEHPKAADTVGIKVNPTRVRTTILGGAVAGLGGAFFTVASGLAFGKEMTAGQGFIALAAMILGRWSPKGALLAALLFGFANNLQVVFGSIGTPIPSQILLMTPYLATIFAVAGLVGRVRPPAAEGTPYIK